MYADEYERRGFPIKDFLLKLLLVVIFVALLCWLLPKFIKPTIVNECQHSGSSASVCDTSGLDALTSQIFADNLEKMKDAAISYYTDDRLPQNVGDSESMTLSDMIGKHLIVPLIDKNNKACDVTASYVKITKNDDEYIMKVNLKDSEKEDYILVHLGCYTYCDSYICEKKESKGFVKGGLGGSTTYKPTKNVPIKVVPTPTPTPSSKYYCSIVNGKYYDNNGNITTKTKWKERCETPDTPTKYYCSIVNGKYYGKDGKETTKAKYKEQCEEPVKPTKYYCSIVNGKYYGKDGKVVSKETWKKQCEEPTPEPKYYCSIVNGKYYGKYGKVVSKATYKKQCEEPTPEPKYYCSIVNGKYYGKDGKVVSKETWKKQCDEPTPEPKYYCSIVNGKYYGKNGNVVSKETYKKECEDEPTPTVSYLYQYKRVTSAQFSAWTGWTAWSKTNCNTKAINCNDASTSCLRKVQTTSRKEKIGEYDKKYVKTRRVLRQTGSYTQKACSKYNYVIVNNTTYATTTTTTYTQINTVTQTTQHTTGSWVYSGRGSYTNPPRDTANTSYKFVGADYSYCNETCTSLPNFYYDKYTYTGGMSSVVNTTSTPSWTSSTSTSTTSTSDVSVDASCGSYVTKTIPIYAYIDESEIATRKEPLYGTVCYMSEKNRTLIANGKITYKWSTSDHSTKLINEGWTYTGVKKVA